MKRIYKDRANKKICGVCAGVAEYLDVDPTLVRVIWGVVGLAYGVGILAYLVCTFVFPDKSELQ